MPARTQEITLDGPVFPQSAPGALQVETGFTTCIGPRERNEDYVGVALGSPEQRLLRGVVAAVADGVGSGRGSRVAAELAVRGFIEAYAGGLAARGVKQVATNAVNAINAWVHAQSRTDAALERMATTLSVLILRGRTAHIVHVGDSRIYRLRHDKLDLLTNDHVLNAFEGRHVLTRSLGGQPFCSIDYGAEALQVGDRFLLCTDGVHGVLKGKALTILLQADAPLADIARSLTDAALAAGGQDNATALVVDVAGLAEARLADIETLVGGLPIRPPPEVGGLIDGLRMDRLVVDGPYTRVFQAVDIVRGAAVFAKFPKANVVGDAVMRQAFLRENWVLSLVRSPYVGEGLARDRSQLYSVMAWYDGETLERRLGRPPSVSATLGFAIAAQLIKGVAALHRAGVIHRDIKPDNVILLSGGGVRLVDLGVARAPQLDEIPEDVAPGTPNYMAPELYAGAPGDERSDIFAIGVTLFRLFTGAYPYAETDSSARPSFRRAAPLARLRPDLPSWLGPVLARAYAFHPQDRPGDAIELLFDLEQGQMRAGAPKPAPLTLYERHPLLIWKLVSAALAFALAASLFASSPARRIAAGDAGHSSAARSR